MKKDNYMVISVDTEEAFGKIQHPLLNLKNSNNKLSEN